MFAAPHIYNVLKLFYDVINLYASAFGTYRPSLIRRKDFLRGQWGRPGFVRARDAKPRLRKGNLEDTAWMCQLHQGSITTSATEWLMLGLEFVFYVNSKSYLAH